MQPIDPPPREFLHGLNFSGVRACIAALVRRILRVSGSGWKSRCASAPVPPEQFNPALHENIERMNPRRQGVEQKATKGTKKFPERFFKMRSVAVLGHSSSLSIGVFR
jgi:hypothetical protein